MIWSLIASAASAIATAVTTIASNMASSLATTLSNTIQTAIKIGQVVLSSIEKIAQILGVLEPHERLEDVGDRALQGAERNILPENFDSYADYMKQLRSFELDPEKSKQYSPEMKVAAGVTVATVGISKTQDLPIESVVGVLTLLTKNSDYFDSDRTGRILQAGAPFVSEVVNYFNDRLNSGQAKEFEKKLCDMEGKLKEGSPTDDFYKELDDALNRIRNVEGNDA